MQEGLAYIPIPRFMVPYAHIYIYFHPQRHIWIRLYFKGLFLGARYLSLFKFSFCSFLSLSLSLSLSFLHPLTFLLFKVFSCELSLSLSLSFPYLSHLFHNFSPRALRQIEKKRVKSANPHFPQVSFCWNGDKREKNVSNRSLPEFLRRLRAIKHQTRPLSSRDTNVKVFKIGFQGRRNPPSYNAQLFRSSLGRNQASGQGTLSSTARKEKKSTSSQRTQTRQKSPVRTSTVKNFCTVQSPNFFLFQQKKVKPSTD